MPDRMITSAPPYDDVATTDATQPKYTSSHTWLTARPSRRHRQATMTHVFESIETDDVNLMTSAVLALRSVSCSQLNYTERRYRIIRIGEGSKELLRLADANVMKLLQIASSSDKSDANNALLARKALRYRKIWTHEVEAQCPSPSC